MLTDSSSMLAAMLDAAADCCLMLLHPVSRRRRFSPNDREYRFRTLPEIDHGLPNAVAHARRVEAMLSSLLGSRFTEMPRLPDPM